MTVNKTKLFLYTIINHNHIPPISNPILQQNSYEIILILNCELLSWDLSAFSFRLILTSESSLHELLYLSRAVCF